MINEILELGSTRHRSMGGGTQYAAVTTLQHVVPVEWAATSTGSLVLSVNTAGWVIEAAKKLEALERLQPGWDSHGGLQLDPDARLLAVRLLGWLGTEELPVPSVVLGSGGTVQFEWRTNGRELDVELAEGGALEFVKVSPHGEIREGVARTNISENLRALTSWLQHG
jgi:hypothetical protein